MKFNIALRALYLKQPKERLTSPFFVYCVLSDACHGSFEDMRLVRQYFEVTQKQNIFQVLISQGINRGIKTLKDFYTDTAEGKQYKSFVKDTVLAMDPHYEIKCKKAKEQKAKAQQAATGQPVAKPVPPKQKKPKTVAKDKSGTSGQAHKAATLERLKQACLDELARCFHNDLENTFVLNIVHRIRSQMLFNRLLRKIVRSKSIREVQRIRCSIADAFDCL